MKNKLFEYTGIALVLLFTGGVFSVNAQGLDAPPPPPTVTPPPIVTPPVTEIPPPVETPPVMEMPPVAETPPPTVTPPPTEAPPPRGQQRFAFDTAVYLGGALGFGRAVEYLGVGWGDGYYSSPVIAAGFFVDVIPFTIVLANSFSLYLGIEAILGVGLIEFADIFPVVPIYARLGGRFGSFDASFNIGTSIGLGFTVGASVGLRLGNGLLFGKLYRVPDGSLPEWLGGYPVSATLFFIGYKSRRGGNR